MEMKDRKYLALECISDRFISHFNIDLWGFSLFIMEKRGKAFCHIYQFNEDNTTVYLNMLSVNDEIRRQGIGTELQLIREHIGRNLGATTSCLWVKKNTWMHDWYKRRGYKDWIDNQDEEDAIWMTKQLIDNVND